MNVRIIPIRIFTPLFAIADMNNEANETQVYRKIFFKYATGKYSFRQKLLPQAAFLPEIKIFLHM